MVVALSCAPCRAQGRPDASRFAARALTNIPARLELDGEVEFAPDGPSSPTRSSGAKGAASRSTSGRRWRWRIS